MSRKKYIVTVEEEFPKDGGWNDKLVKKFARVYCGNDDYWEYFNEKTIDEKLKKFKRTNKIGE
jgi:hypothetical protein